MQVEGIYTAEPRFEAQAKALKLKQEMAAAAEEGRKRLRGMPGLDLVETPKPLERQIRAEVEARVPEKVWKPKTIRTFEEEPRKKVLPDFSNLKDVTGYGPDGGGSGRSGSIDIPSFWESTGQAAVGGATRSLGTQMDVWGTQYQRWQPGRSQMNAEQSSWYQEQYQSELRTYYSMLDENKDKPGTYSWAALENQKRILNEAGQRAGIFQKVDQYQKQAGEATRDLAQDTYLKGQNIVDQAADGRGARGQKWADFVANGTELLINSVIDKTLGPEAALLYRMGNQYGAATMQARANGKTLEQQHRAGTLSASGTAAGTLLGNALKISGEEDLLEHGLQNNPFARAFIDGVATAGYVNGERGMGEVSDAVTYPESYRFDPNTWNRDTLTAWALGSVGSLLGQAFGSRGGNGRCRRNNVEGNNLPVPITPQPQLPGGQNASLLPTGNGAAWLLPRTNDSYMSPHGGTSVASPIEVRNQDIVAIAGALQERGVGARDAILTAIDLAEVKQNAGKNMMSMTEKAYDEAFEKGFNYDIMQEIRENYSDALKEELKSGRAREESKEEFIQRANREGMGVYEGKTTTYGFRRVGDTSKWGIVQRTETGFETQKELAALGIRAEVVEGDILWNKAGITHTKTVSQAATLEHGYIVINYRADMSPKEIAGHEAFHLWKNNPGKDKYDAILEDNLNYSSAEFIDFQQKIAEYYLGGDIDVTDEAQFARLKEEIFAYISGMINVGIQEKYLRSMFWNYDAVKAAWYELIRKNR